MFCADSAEHQKNQWLQSENNGLKRTLKLAQSLEKESHLAPQKEISEKQHDTEKGGYQKGKGHIRTSEGFKCVVQQEFK